MKRSVYLFTTLAIAACGGGNNPANPAEVDLVERIAAADRLSVTPAAP